MIFNDDRDHVRFLPGRHRTAGVSRRTWRRWMTGQARIPFAVIQLARVFAGELIQGGETWRGWLLKADGELVDPEGVRHSPASVSAWHWLAQELSALRGKENQEKLQRLKTGNDGAALTRELQRRLHHGGESLPSSRNF